MPLSPAAGAIAFCSEPNAETNQTVGDARDGLNGNLLRQSLRLGLSILITCAIAQHFQHITYLWYPCSPSSSSSTTRIKTVCVLLAEGFSAQQLED